jgi:hypothetical protein
MTVMRLEHGLGNVIRMHAPQMVPYEGRSW